MQCKKCLRTLASALIIAAAALALSGAANASTTYKIIHEFQAPKQPQGNLKIDAAGNLYGTTYFGGNPACTVPPGGCGVVWKLAPNGSFTMLYEFTGAADGAFPAAGLIFDKAGNLYGTASDGGSNDCSGDQLGRCGVVFRLAPNPDGTWTESVLHSFTGTDGQNPYAGLIFDAAGNLYGTAAGGGTDDAGVVFKLAPNADGTWTESVLHSFTRTDGFNPLAGLIFDPAGNLYGTTFRGGGAAPCDDPTGCGVAFRLAPNPDGTWAESVLHAFTQAEATPNAVILDTAGNLYGTTAYMNVFKLAPNVDGTWTEIVLYSFKDGTGGENGNQPNAGLIFDVAGNLYGTTYYGGRLTACKVEYEPNNSGCGVVFKLTPTSSGWSETVLWKFYGLAKYPAASLIFDPRGNLYGTTTSGTENYGVVFKITP